MSRLSNARTAPKPRKAARTALAAASITALLALPAAPAAADDYQIQQGDTLSGIAVRFGTTVRRLVQLNGLRNSHLIIAGRTLAVPGAGSSGGASGGSSAGAAGGRHVVKPGETLSGIAARHGTTVRTLVSLNALRSPDRIIAGQSLTLPSSGSGGGSGGATPVASSASRRHLVQAGETLTGIARRYGISSSDLAAWNGITRTDVVYAGSSLVLYNPGQLASRTITCPVPGARFGNGWGFPRPGGRVHAGNDLFAPRGTPVHAPVSGVVTTRVGSIGGLQFRLVDSAGNHWVGTHLDQFGKTGRVNAGDIIGYVGDTGNAKGTNPHLHFEYQPGGGEAVNAYPLLRQAC